MPDIAIQNLHNTPHLSYNFVLQDNEFGITSESVWNSYSQSIFTLPVIIGVIGFLCVLSFQIFWCCTSSVSWPDRVSRSETYAWMKESISSRKKITILFYVSLALVIVSMSTYYSAVIRINDGFSTYYDALNFLDDTFTTLDHEGDNLEQQGVYIGYNLGNSTCPAAPTVADTLDYYYAAIEDYEEYVEPVSSPVSNANDQGHYFSKWKTVVVWSVAGAIYFGIALFFIAHYCHSKVLMHVAIGVTELVLIVVIASNVIWFSLLVSKECVLTNVEFIFTASVDRY